ncbi:hypothetical protein B9Z19DRAFT_1061452 [Tuber borchii]|uniref:Uncharacterized protein n=1 Tax=Tuber borchii TaxID=42251 RepID=A0A2T7A5B9_TUBBO|nr:hypothetical protein B9Z19DRAFT_1061452 [Tuber borchii]
MVELVVEDNVSDSEMLSKLEDMEVESEELDGEYEEYEMEIGEPEMEYLLLQKVKEEPDMRRDAREDYSKEQIVFHSIDATTKFHHLAARIMKLNHQGKVKAPLVGNFEATLYIYKANKEQKGIEELFIATFLPLLMNEAKVPTGFGISLKDLFGGHMPNKQDAEHVVWFDFKRSEKFVSETEKCRVNAHVVKWLMACGYWEEWETWVQGKRTCLNR